MTADTSLDPLGAEESSAPLAGLAMALTGDRPSAATVLAQARSRSRRSELTVRDLVAEAARRRREPLEDPVRDELPAELELVADALDRLTPLQRTTLVATRLGRLTYAETASILDRSPAVVSRSVAKAATAIGGDPYAVSAALEQLSWQHPTPAEEAAADRTVAKRRSRRRWAIGAVAATLLLAVATSVVVPLLGPAPPAYARRDGDWTYGLALVPSPGWTVRAHLLSRTQETITVARDGTDAVCRLAASRAAVPPPSPRPGRAVRINGRRGSYLSGGEPRLVWPLGGDATGTSSCTGTSDDRGTAVAFARDLRIESVPLRLPFRLARLPLATRLGPVGEKDGHTSISIVSTTGWTIDTEAVGISIYRVSYGTGLDDLPPEGWKSVDQLGSVSACRTVEHRQFCIVEPTRSAFGGSGSKSSGLVPRIIEAMEFVDAVGDESRWLDANEALPR